MNNFTKKDFLADEKLDHIKDTNATDTVFKEKVTKKKLLLYCGSSFIIVVAGLYFGSAIINMNSADFVYKRSNVRIAEVQQGLLEHSISSDGKIVAVIKPDIFAPVEGNINIKVNLGDNLKKGDVLAVIENPELVSQMQKEAAVLERLKIEFSVTKTSSEQAVAEANGNLLSAKIRREAAERELVRYKEAFHKGVVGESQFESYQDQFFIAKADFEQAMLKLNFSKENSKTDIGVIELRIKEQEILVDELKRKVDAMTITSPISGSVGAMAVQENDRVQKDQKIASVVDLSDFGVEIKVPEVYATDVNPGVESIVTYENKQLKAKVVSVSPEVINNQIEIRANFIDAVSADLRQNQRVQVKLILKKKENAIKVQRGAFLNSDQGKKAYIVDGDIATAVPIQIGLLGVNEVEIIQGLSEGDKIIISNTEAFNTGKTVFLK